MYNGYIYYPETYSTEELSSKLNYEGISNTIKFIVTENEKHNITSSYIAMENNNSIGYVEIGNYSNRMIYCYGNASNLLNSISLAKEFCEKYKITVILFDYPGYGISDGKPNEKSLIDALGRVIDKIGNCHLVGESIGAGVVLSYIGTYGTSKVKSVNLISPFSSLVSVISKNSIVELFYDITGTCFYRNYYNISKINWPLPVTIINLQEDTLIGPKHSIILANICKHCKHITLNGLNRNITHGNFGYIAINYVNF